MLSLVAPMKDEAGNVRLLYERSRAVLGSIPVEDWEFVMIDDGSEDGTFEAIRELAAEDPRVKGVRHASNYGQTAGIETGFKYSRGDIVITMDADLQNPPELIPGMLSLLGEGYGAVNASRRQRRDQSFGRWFPSLFSNRFATFLSGVEVSDFGSGMKAIKREYLDGLELIGDFHRYYLVLLAERGCRITEVGYDYVPRYAGETKYGLKRLFKGPIDLLYLCVLRRGGRFFGWKARMMRKHYYRVGSRRIEVSETT